MIDFIGIGAQKSGTSWVYACLYEHPEICAPVKEIHFFSRPRFKKGKDWYESHFSKCTPGKLRGEFSTSYLYAPEAPARIKSLYPNAKLIAILRNPVTRAYSHYHNSIKSGEINKTLSFEAFCAQEVGVLAQGKYMEQLQRYLGYFDRSQMLVLVYEDAKKNPRAFIKKIYEFLGIQGDYASSMLFSEVNISRTPRYIKPERWMHPTAEFLRRSGFDRLVHAIRKTGVTDWIRKHNTKTESPIQNDFDQKAIIAYVRDDVAQLSQFLNRDLLKEWGMK